MAKIEWEDQAKFQFRHYVKNARLEFGEKTAKLGATDQYKNLSEHHCWLRGIMINEIQKING